MIASVLPTDDLKALYQEIILDHAKHPRNSHIIEHGTCKAMGSNPLCGDRVIVSAQVSPESLIEDVAAEGKGCAISLASASLMTEVLKGLSVEMAELVFKAVHQLCTGQTEVENVKKYLPSSLSQSVDKLASLSGVKQFPVRVKCATLPWHTLMQCLQGRSEATTES